VLHHRLQRKTKTIENIRCFPETLAYSKDMTDYQNRIDQARAEFEAAKAHFLTVSTDEAKQQVSKTYDVWFDIQNEPKLAEAKEKAAEAWVRWATANDNTKKAFITYRKTVDQGGDYETYKKYEQACEDRDSKYKDATEANEEVWRLESLTAEEI
jgi:hypothetical protein